MPAASRHAVSAPLSIRMQAVPHAGVNCAFNVTATSTGASPSFTVTKAFIHHNCDASTNIVAAPRKLAASTALVEKLQIHKAVVHVRAGSIAKTAAAVASTMKVPISKHVAYKAIHAKRRNYFGTDVDTDVDLGYVIYVMLQRMLQRLPPVCML